VWPGQRQRPRPPQEAPRTSGSYAGSLEGIAQSAPPPVSDRGRFGDYDTVDAVFIHAALLINHNRPWIQLDIDACQRPIYLDAEDVDER
jgi:hypothetical protein